MKETAMQIRGDGSAEVYRGARQYLRVTGTDGEPEWFKRTSRELRPVSEHRARRLERAYRHPEKLKQVQRFPRLPAEDVAAEEVEKRFDALEAQAFDWIARGHEANIQLGRNFLQMKALMKALKGHGRWEPYFIETFEPRGIPLRTGQHYMQLAKEADSVSAKLALFPLATDEEAQEINAATAAAQEAVAIAQKKARDEGEEISPRRGWKSHKNSRRVSRVQPYTLVLPLPRETAKKMDQLRTSAHWDSAVPEITAFFKTLIVKYDIVANT